MEQTQCTITFKYILDNSVDSANGIKSGEDIQYHREMRHCTPQWYITPTPTSNYCVTFSFTLIKYKLELLMRSTQIKDSHLLSHFGRNRGHFFKNVSSLFCFFYTESISVPHPDKTLFNEFLQLLKM